jgi:aminoglycoside 6'-N-acetyltransferase I
VKIAKISQDDFNEWLDLALKLWSDEAESLQEMQNSLTNILKSPREEGFIVRDDDERAIGFMNLSLRSDYVPGATQSPVAYVEGIYLEEEARKQGIGKSLIQYAEKWALDRGCVELASDALLENQASHAFHTKVGFQEVERVVFFIKPITALD